MYLVGMWRSPVAYKYGVLGVAGSNPVIPTNFYRAFKECPFYLHIYFLLIIISVRRGKMMNNSWEKTKDIFYDLIRYVFILFIIAGIGVLIYWRLNKMFGAKDLFKFQGTPVTIATDEGTIENKEAVVHETKNPNMEEFATADEITKHTVHVEDTGESHTIETYTINFTDVSDMFIVGKELKDRELIQNIYDFVDRVKERKVEGKIKAGTKKIEKGMSIDEIIDVLMK